MASRDAALKLHQRTSTAKRAVLTLNAMNAPFVFSPIPCGVIGSTTDSGSVSWGSSPCRVIAAVRVAEQADFSLGIRGREPVSKRDFPVGARGWSNAKPRNGRTGLPVVRPRPPTTQFRHRSEGLTIVAEFCRRNRAQECRTLVFVRCRENNVWGGVRLGQGTGRCLQLRWGQPNRVRSEMKQPCGVWYSGACGGSVSFPVPVLGGVAEKGGWPSLGVLPRNPGAPGVFSTVIRGTCI